MSIIFENTKYIVFDLDGTLVDSVPDLTKAVSMTLIDLGRDEVTDDEVRGWIGNGAEIMLKRALSRNILIDPDLDENLYEIARTRFDDYYANNGHGRTLVYPKVKETLTELAEAGFQMGIVTNKPYAFVPAILRDLGLSTFFVDVIGGDSLSTNKPNPEGLWSLRDKYGLSNGEIIMVGDSKNDIIAAKNAGFASIGLTYGYNYGEPIEQYAPDAVADTFCEILDILKVAPKAPIKA